jgi:hypothetical protein
MIQTQRSENLNEEGELLKAISKSCAAFRQKYPEDCKLQAEMEKEMDDIFKLVTKYITITKGPERKEGKWFPAGEVSLFAEPIPLFEFSPGWAFAVTQDSKLVRMQCLLFKCDGCGDWHLQNIIGDNAMECSFSELQINEIPLCIIAEGIEKFIFKKDMREHATQPGAQA